MNIFVYNTLWMTFNVFLALIPIVAGVIVLENKNVILKIIFFFILLIFIPNTLYIITDLLHVPKQIYKLDNLQKVILLIQYLLLGILGLLCFVLSVNIFEKIIAKVKFHKSTINFLIIILNFAIGFGMVLGRILRVNSWDVFINTEKIIRDSFYVLSSSELIIMAFSFGFLGNIIYFLFRKKIMRSLSGIYRPLKQIIRLKPKSYS